VAEQKNLSGMGSHQSSVMGKDEWLTPPHIFKALGPFDLDPCAPSKLRRPWEIAEEHFSIDDDGLSQEWFGRVWCNPPYGLEAARWLARMAEHGNGIALIFARTETTMFFEHVWSKAAAVLFLKGRLHFHHVDGSRARANAGAPSVLVAYGFGNVSVLKNSGLAGHFVHLGGEHG
jgi:hypothetical protein